MIIRSDSLSHLENQPSESLPHLHCHLPTIAPYFTLSKYYEPILGVPNRRKTGIWLMFLSSYYVPYIVSFDPQRNFIRYFFIFGCKEYNQSYFSTDHWVMFMCEVISCVVGKGCLLWPVHLLGKTLLVFALLHSVFQAQICLLLKVFLDFLLLHSSLLQWKGHLCWPVPLPMHSFRRPENKELLVQLTWRTDSSVCTYLGDSLSMMCPSC